RRASYSNYGDWIDIAAPGTAIWSTFWDQGSSYRTDTGTSMAAPHVTGVIALLLSIRPNLNRAEVEAILRTTADPIMDPGSGSGTLEVAAPDFAPPSWVGGGVIRSDTPVAAVVQLVRSGFDAMGYVGQIEGAPRAFGPLVFRNRNGWTSTTFVQNPSAEPANVELVYRSSAGLAGVWAETAMLPPGSVRGFNQGATPGLPDAFVGSVELRSSGGQPLV